MIANLLLVAAGGAAGSASRYLISSAALRAFGPGFPVGTLIVNVAGCLMMGLMAALLAFRFNLSEPLRLLLATGFLGGFTTFSAFALDFAVLWERGEMGLAFLYAVVSVLVSLAALFAGLWLVRSMA